MFDTAFTEDTNISSHHESENLPTKSQLPNLSSFPIGSMYDIFAYIWIIWLILYSKYTIRPMDAAGLDIQPPWPSRGSWPVLGHLLTLKVGSCISLSQASALRNLVARTNGGGRLRLWDEGDEGWKQGEILRWKLLSSLVVSSCFFYVFDPCFGEDSKFWLWFFQMGWRCWRHGGNKDCWLNWW